VSLVWRVLRYKKSHHLPHISLPLHSSATDPKWTKLGSIGVWPNVITQHPHQFSGPMLESCGHSRGRQRNGGRYMPFGTLTVTPVCFDTIRPAGLLVIVASRCRSQPRDALSIIRPISTNGNVFARVRRNDKRAFSVRVTYHCFKLQVSVARIQPSAPRLLNNC